LAEYSTPAEVSQKLKISTKQVIRFFEGRVGVLNLGGERSSLLVPKKWSRAKAAAQSEPAEIRPQIDTATSYSKTSCSNILV